MPQSGIYVIANSSTNDMYVGSSSHVKSRWNKHFNALAKGAHHSVFLQRAYNKYGKDAFTAYVIEDVEPIRELLIEREQHWIDTLHPAYNMSQQAVNGTGIPASEETKALLLRYSSQPHSEERNRQQREREVTAETRRKMSENAKLRTYSEETRQKLRDAKLGITQSEETKRKRSESLTGRVFSEESRNKSSESNKRTWANKTEEERQDFSYKARNRPPISEETRRKQSEAKKGRKPSDALMKASIARHTGAKRSEETRAKMRISNKAAAERRKASKQQEIVEGVTQYKMFG